MCLCVCVCVCVCVCEVYKQSIDGSLKWGEVVWQTADWCIHAPLNEPLHEATSIFLFHSTEFIAFCMCACVCECVFM